MGRPVRILVVTLGLVLAGAVLGGLAGLVAFALAILLTEGSLTAADLKMVAFSGYFGAMIGAVAAPAAGWLLLRRVPLGRAMLWTVVGAVVGGVIGWTAGGGMVSFLHTAVPALGDAFDTALLGAILGFVIAAIVLRRKHRVASTKVVPHDEPAD